MPATYSGIGVSSGVAVGPVARVHGPVLPPRDGAPVDVEAETDRAADALDAVGGELEALAQRAGVSGAVLVRQARISRDPSLGVDGRAAGQHRPGRAAGRVGGLRRLPRHARGRPDARGARTGSSSTTSATGSSRGCWASRPPGIPDPGTPYVLVARDLSPAVTAGLDPQRVLAIVTERGGPTQSHRRAGQGARHPGRGRVPGRRVAAQRSAGPGRRRRGRGHRRSGSRETVGCGRAVAVGPAGSGVGDRPEPTGPGPHPRRPPGAADGGGRRQSRTSRTALEAGAEGVGVFRTEFAFLDRLEPPSVAEQADGLPRGVRRVRRHARSRCGRSTSAPTSRRRTCGSATSRTRRSASAGLRVARRHPELLDRPAHRDRQRDPRRDGRGAGDGADGGDDLRRRRGSPRRRSWPASRRPG